MSSEAAAKWLVQEHASDGCIFLNTRSWEVSDQMFLASHFLRNIPHASSICYENLLSFMSINNFLRIVASKLDGLNEKDLGLLRYYIVPALDAETKSEKHNILIQQFVEQIT
jgi:phosphoglycerol transferase MdoB-like AlkP superfamily enzyme